MAAGRTARLAGKNNIASPARRGLRHILIALAASAGLVAAPLAAQDPDAEPRLEDLIPDSAIENPEEWAGEGVPAEAAAASETQPFLDPEAPMVELPRVDIPWPETGDLPELAGLEAEQDIEFAEIEEDFLRPLPDGSEERISDDLVLVFPSDRSLFPEREEFLDRFEALSTIEELDGEGAKNVAMLAARAAEDEELLFRLLRIYGYYDPQVIRTIGTIQPGEDRIEDDAGVRFDVVPGSQYVFGAIDLGMLDAAGADYPALRGAFGIATGDPLLSDRIVAERYNLDEALGESGYPFAAIAEPELLVDHARQEGDLTMPVTPGGRYRFGRVSSNLEDFLPSEHLADIARFAPGDTYRRSLEMDLRRAIYSTGLVSSVVVTAVPVAEPVEGEPGTVDLAVEMEKAPLRTIAGSLGYGTGEGLRAELSWEHRSFFPPEGLIRVRGVAGTREQLAGFTFRRNNVNGRDTILTVDAYATTTDREAYEARTASVLATYEQVSTLLFQKPFTWSVGLEGVATDEREVKDDDSEGPRTTYIIGALPMLAQLDTSDSLLDPTRGWRLGARVSPEVSHQNDETSFYARAQIDASAYQQLGEKLVLAQRVRLGSIQGAELHQIAPSRRFYAGGGGSVRGYGYQAIGPRDGVGEPNGGRSLFEVSAEARIRTGMFDGALSVVPFVDAGTVSRDSFPDFDDFRIGAGIGVRYHTSFGPIRVDVGVPLNPQAGDPPVGVYVSLGQAF